MRFLDIVSILLFLFIAGCTDDLDPVYVINLDEQVQLTIKEDLSNKSSNVIFSFELNEPYECTNATMTTEIRESVLPNTTRIRLEGIVVDGPCISGESTLPTELSLSLLPDNYGKHEFSIVIGDKVDNTGVLHVKENKFEFVLENEETIIVAKSVVDFVPESLIWGYLEIFNETYTDLAIQKLSEIEDLLSPMQLENGNYGYFIVNDNNLFIEPALVPLTQGIKGTSQQLTPSELLEKVNDINDESEGKFRLNIFTWDGRKS
jgi:hypothetical protein